MPITSKNKKSLSVAQTQTFDAGSGDGGSEVVAFYDGKLYVTNGAQDRIDVFDAATGTLETSIDLTTITGYDGVNSVAVSAAGIAVAVHRDNASYSTGVVAVFDHAYASLAEVEVGNLPDMVTFSADGTKIFVANEGEEDLADYAGSISIITVDGFAATTYDFSAFDAQAAALEAAGIRLFDGKLPSTDFEPEYITEGPDGKLYVTLQEANAVAVFDLTLMAWEEILPLGVVDHSLKGNGFDASDKDDAINITTHPVFGMRMPDAIASVEIKGNTYFLTANEGDARAEDVRVEDLTLDETAFPDAADLQTDEDLGRLQVSSIDGDGDYDGDYDELYSYGTRSFTIFDADGNVVFDSGDDFETIIAELRVPNAFNNDDFPNDDAGVVDDNRSDAKGPEPEAIAVGEVNGKTLAFIGLERDSGIMVYDITRPAKAKFLSYIDSGDMGHISPEVITFIAPEDSTTGTAQIAVSFEVSGTTALFDVTFDQSIRGTNGKDVIEGTIGADTIDGRKRADWIDAGLGDDKVIGGHGRDRIDGGEGDDLLQGGAHRDIFIFELGDGNDKIRDLEHADLIDMSATGLTFDDLTITEEGRAKFLVEYGDEGDTIMVKLRGHSELDADSFLF